MKTKLILPVTVAAAFLAFSGATFAQTGATATTGLNVRSGPGPQYPVGATIDGDDEVTVNGCLEESNWCTVTYNGGEGWVYSDYLANDVSGSHVGSERRADIGLPVVTIRPLLPPSAPRGPSFAMFSSG